MLRKISITTILLLVACSAVVCAAPVLSPNKKVSVDCVEGRGLIVSYLNNGAWQQIMTMPTECNVISDIRQGDVSYTMQLGKASSCSNQFTSCVLSNSALGKTLVVKVYNDGVAWKGAHDYRVDFSASQNNWLMQWTDSYESFYPKNREQKVGERYGYPALFEYNDGVFALLTESCMERENAGTSYYSAGGNVFDLRPDGRENGGWQTLIVGSLADVVESTLVTDNAAPCRLDDTSWIEPGVCSWIYWAYNHGSNDITIIRKYIDLAVKLKLPYVLIDAEWDEMDKVAANEGKTIEDAVRECVEAGVKPLIWYSSSIGWINGAPGPKFRLNKPEDREREFAWCENIGVKGVKIDFFNGDVQQNFEFMIDLLECAAKHHLTVNFHGATLPRGWQRTYPNLVSTEAVYGAEWYNNRPVLTNKAACHNATLPFTRNVVGSMDYTPCAFSDSQHPHITSHAHELALTVLYESGVQHLADRPESLLAQPKQVQQFFGQLPTVWDETRLLSGYPGESVVMARRSGTTWYVAGINGADETKCLTFATDRMQNLGKKVTLFEDSGKKKAPWKLSSRKLTLPAEMKINTHPRGGFVMIIE